MREFSCIVSLDEHRRTSSESERFILELDRTMTKIVFIKGCILYQRLRGRILYCAIVNVMRYRYHSGEERKQIAKKMRERER
jgi:hypothetical protein